MTMLLIRSDDETMSCPMLNYYHGSDDKESFSTENITVLPAFQQMETQFSNESLISFRQHQTAVVLQDTDSKAFGANY